MSPEDLVEIEAIKRLKYRYVRCIDQKLFDELEDCFVEDATASYGGGAYPFEGRAAIMEFLRSSLGPTTMLTSHRVHEPEIDLTGSNTATGVWALEDTVIFSDQPLAVRGAAFYTDDYVRVDGTWRIRHTGYRRLYELLEPRPSDVRIMADWWATGGRSQIQP